MYGKSPTTLFAVFANALPGKDDEYNYWCDRIHIPDSIEAGLFYDAYRYRAEGTGPVRYLTLWESELKDLQTGMQRMRPHAERFKTEGRIWPVYEVVWSQVMVPVHPPSLGRGEVRTVTTLQNDWREPMERECFEDWYASAGLDKALASSRYHSTYRYESYDGPAGRFLTVCESDEEVEALSGGWQGIAAAGPTPFAHYTTIFEERDDTEADPEAATVGGEGPPGAAWATHWLPLPRGAGL
jgi:hypothetical protein